MFSDISKVMPFWDEENKVPTNTWTFKSRPRKGSSGDPPSFDVTPFSRGVEDSFINIIIIIIFFLLKLIALWFFFSSFLDRWKIICFGHLMLYCVLFVIYSMVCCCLHTTFLIILVSIYFIYFFLLNFIWGW